MSNNDGSERKAVVKPQTFPANGFVRRDGRLTAKGREAVAEFVAKYDNPIGFLLKMYPSVGRVINNLIRQGVLSREDFIQEIAIEASAAVRNFDPSKGTTVMTYLVWQIVKVGSETLRRNERRMRLNVYSMDREFGDTKASLNDFFPDPKSVEERDGPYHADAVSRAMGLLPEREREMVTSRVVCGRRFRDIGLEHGVSTERVRQIVRRAMGRMRDSIEHHAGVRP